MKTERALVAHFSRPTLSRQFLTSIQVELNMPQLCPIVGTENRWFHKMSEVERLLELRSAVEVFQERVASGGRDVIEGGAEVVEEDWILMQEYVNAVKPFKVLSKYLGGEQYPACCSVIPALDQIHVDRRGEIFINTLLANFERRFPDCWRSKTPFNCLRF